MHHFDNKKETDRLFGGAGNDLLVGDKGDDYLDGGSGDDLIIGRGGTDTIIAGKGNDIIYSDDIQAYHYKGIIPIQVHHSA